VFGGFVGGEGFAQKSMTSRSVREGFFADDEEATLRRMFVGLGDGGGFEDAWVGLRDGFDFVGVDVEAGDEIMSFLRSSM